MEQLALPYFYSHCKNIINKKNIGCVLLILLITLLMPSVAVATTDVANAQQEIDFSVKSLYSHAHVVVKAVIIILFIASIITWTTALNKVTQIVRASKDLVQQNDIMQQCSQFSNMQKKLTTGIAKNLINALNIEMQQSQNIIDDDLKNRLEQVLQIHINYHSQKIRKGIVILASIGSISPFIGLFGTVWGIMNSFTNIAKTGSTDLFAIAPGIAEALFATAFGLAVAIPAVLIYNLLNRLAQGYNEQLEHMAMSLQVAVNRHLSLIKNDHYER